MKNMITQNREIVYERILAWQTGRVSSIGGGGGGGGGGPRGSFPSYFPDFPPYNFKKYLLQNNVAVFLVFPMTNNAF